MILYLITALIISTCMSLILSQSPLTSGLLILLMAISLASLYALLISSWSAFLIFLIYIGGMLVMFSYFVALTPNQMKISVTSLMTSLPIITLLLFLNQIHFMKPFSSHSIHFLYLPNNTLILLLLSLLLLFTMIIIVKITNLVKGPLRPFLHSYVETFTNHPPFSKTY